ncbi:unnamed protein product [Miscanthus lutarioriparius]|uniref:Uncharacterized protein n=1 Tax=Miscanthus lutarioriparius TaxID=422564 RepID=A0A811PU52_9POAL|nr:unnamed protein product [Miscanthus lutarioriparius]
MATPAVSIIHGSNDTIHDLYGFTKAMYEWISLMMAGTKTLGPHPRGDDGDRPPRPPRQDKGKAVEQPRQKKQKHPDRQTQQSIEVAATTKAAKCGGNNDSLYPTEPQQQPEPGLGSRSHHRARDDSDVPPTEAEEESRSRCRGQDDAEVPPTEEEDGLPPCHVDLRGASTSRVKRYRLASLDQWFPEQRDVRAGDSFYTTLQASFFRTFESERIALRSHRLLQLGFLRAAAGSEEIQQHIEYLPGLEALVTRPGLTRGTLAPFRHLLSILEFTDLLTPATLAVAAGFSERFAEACQLRRERSRRSRTRLFVRMSTRTWHTCSARTYLLVTALMIYFRVPSPPPSSRAHDAEAGGSGSGNAQAGGSGSAADTSRDQWIREMFERQQQAHERQLQAQAAAHEQMMALISGLSARQDQFQAQLAQERQTTQCLLQHLLGQSSLVPPVQQAPTAPLQTPVVPALQSSGLLGQGGFVQQQFVSPLTEFPCAFTTPGSGVPQGFAGLSQSAPAASAGQTKSVLASTSAATASCSLSATFNETIGLPTSSATAKAPVTASGAIESASTETVPSSVPAIFKPLANLRNEEQERMEQGQQLEAAVKPNVRIRQQQTLSIFTKFPAQIESKRRQILNSILTLAMSHLVPSALNQQNTGALTEGRPKNLKISCHCTAQLAPIIKEQRKLSAGNAMNGQRRSRGKWGTCRAVSLEAVDGVEYVAAVHGAAVGHHPAPHGRADRRRPLHPPRPASPPVLDPRLPPQPEEEDEEEARWRCIRSW